MNLNKPEKPHYLSYCNLCMRDVVHCGQCGNNTCNGGYGEIMGPNPGETISCPFCPSAYEARPTLEK